MDMSQYLEIFIEESKEHLQSLNECLLQLENEPDNMELLNEVFRVAHTLKGMAGTMGFTKMQTLTHDMENALSSIRNGNIQVNTNVIDLLFQCLDALESYLDNIVNTGLEGEKAYNHLIQKLNQMLTGDGSTNDRANEKDKKNINSKAEEKNNALSLTDYEKNVITTGFQQGYKAYAITICLNASCVLKSARAFIVFRTLERHGEIIKSTPNVEDIEDEKFELEFSVVVLSRTEKEVFSKELLSIAEITDVKIIEIEDHHVNPNKNQQNIQQKELVQSQTKVQKDKKAKQDHPIKPRAGKTVRVDIERLDTLMNLVSELIIVKNSLEDIDRQADQNFNESIEYLERITTNLHDAVMKVRMVPVERVFNRFPRMIRDLSRQLSKDIHLDMSGEDTELDRTVIDEIGDPLIHLLRNAADHGLETTEERKSKGKSPEGHIYLRAYQDGNNVVIEVEDDGFGIDAQKIKQKALEKEIVTSEIADNMTEQELVELLFQPSFSTASKVTDVSGRGVGLDVVKTKIEALGGDIEVKTKIGSGSKFTVRLPLTLAIIQALMVQVGLEKYAIPLNTIHTIEDIPISEVKTVQKQEVIVLRNTVIPIVRLHQILDTPQKDIKQKDMLTIVIVRKGEKQAGFVVDDLVGQQEIVIKSLGKYLSHIKMIAGATILGDGEVALILDVNTLV
ncbi:MAG: chemotaxis protein CheA [Epulopiscium sp.]|nr:chemotaxis protein CheA [Candidatus Epulonipiscium sp.]